MLKKYSVILFSLYFATSVGAAPEIADDFDIKDGRVASEKLSGQSTPVGGAKWRTVGNFFLTSAGAVSIPPGGGSVAVDLDTGAGEWIVQADLKPRGKEWIGIALGGAKLETEWLNPETGSQMMVYLRSNGNAGVYLQGTKTAVLKNKERRISNFNENGFNHIKIIYDVAHSKLTIEANGEPLVEQVDLNKFGFTPDIKKAGFHFHPGDGSEVGELDNFKVIQR